MTDDRPWGDVGTTLLFENERVRVWELRLEPGQRSDLHHHATDYVMIQLEGDEVAAEFEPDSEDAFGGATMPDRTIRGPVSPGMVVWGSAGGKETAVNVGTETFREVVVELKDPPA
ncbi:MAG: hypothetical protein DHS20C19_29690 [Acidimicrobiales bacterium]|nr:MAG: hypothetical protein DHS20C19_29690 [Acidimicrobiales bacterium]